MTEATQSLRHAGLTRVLSALAKGEASSEALVRACLDAAEADNAKLRAWLHIDRIGALEAARESDERRAAGRPLGRLDGVPLAVMDNIEVAGMPMTVGLPAGGMLELEDAHVIARLRGAGAVILGKTNLDEASFGAVGRNPHHGDVRNPRLPGKAAGGAAAGAAAAVAAGHAAAAITTDTMGSTRIPAAFCGLVGLRPTYGELSRRGMAPALRRVDSIGVIGRDVADLAPLLHVMAGYDPEDPRSRKRRVPLAPPDWQPGSLRLGVVNDLRSLGVADDVVVAFRQAIDQADGALGAITPMSLDIAALEVAVSRRAALLLMEAEIVAGNRERLPSASMDLKQMLGFARNKNAIDYAVADRRLDGHEIHVRRLFEHYDVLLMPTVPSYPPEFGAEAPANLADFTALASLAGCPAISLPLPGGLGLQLVGDRGSDLRLCELAQVLGSVLGAAEG